MEQLKAKLIESFEQLFIQAIDDEAEIVHRIKFTIIENRFGSWFVKICFELFDEDFHVT
jgi:hypothetical protein